MITKVHDQSQLLVVIPEHDVSQDFLHGRSHLIVIADHSCDQLLGFWVTADLVQRELIVKDVCKSGLSVLPTEDKGMLSTREDIVEDTA